MNQRAAKLIIIFAVALAGFVSARTGSTAARVETEPAPQRRARTGSQHATRRTTTRAPRIDYTRFRHSTRAHQRSCDSCHKFPSSNWKDVGRKGVDAFEDVTEYPEHSSCINCHRTQFFARERPQPRICSVCHVNVTPRDQARKPFPNPLERFRASRWARDFDSDFRVFFPHDKHSELFGMNAAPPHGARFFNASYRLQDAAKENASCANCHAIYEPQGKSDDEFVTKPPKDLGDNYWLKKGTFMTTPTSHSACFTCHSVESGLKPAPSDCATCHRLPAAVSVTPLKDFDPKLAASVGVEDLVMLSKWRRRDSSATFRHEGGMHPELSCATCHNVSRMDTTDERSTRVRVLSCGGGEGGCHITPTSDDGGIFNFEMDKRKTQPAFECVKCHLTYGRSPAPASHSEATSKPKAD